MYLGSEFVLICILNTIIKYLPCAKHYSNRQKYKQILITSKALSPYKKDICVDYILILCIYVFMHYLCILCIYALFPKVT